MRLRNPQVGDMLVYYLSADDVAEITRRRTTSEKIAKQLAIENWPRGAQAHIGNPVSEGQCFPMVVVRTSSPDSSPIAVSGQVFLDGNDVLWVQEVPSEDSLPHPKNGCWSRYLPLGELVKEALPL